MHQRMRVRAAWRACVYFFGMQSSSVSRTNTSYIGMQYAWRYACISVVRNIFHSSLFIFPLCLFVRVFSTRFLLGSNRLVDFTWVQRRVASSFAGCVRTEFVLFIFFSSILFCVFFFSSSFYFFLLLAFRFFIFYFFVWYTNAMCFWNSMGTEGRLHFPRNSKAYYSIIMHAATFSFFSFHCVVPSYSFSLALRIIIIVDAVVVV